jgi:hypothetical protein
MTRGRRSKNKGWGKKALVAKSGFENVYFFRNFSIANPTFVHNELLYLSRSRSITYLQTSHGAR